MGLFGSLFGKKGYSYILDIAGLITDSETVLGNLKTALESPDKYFSENEWRYVERGVVVGKTDKKMLYWLALVDELAEGGCLFEVDYKCELEDFFWALERLNDYDRIIDDIDLLKLGEGEGIEAWGEKINRSLNGKAFVCYFDIDSDSYPLVIVSGGALERVKKLAADNGQSVEDF